MVVDELVVVVIVSGVLIAPRDEVSLDIAAYGEAESDVVVTADYLCEPL